MLAAIVSFLLAVASILFSQAAFPQEASGWAAATDALISAFDRADVMVLGEGHGRKADSDFRVALVRNAKFVDAVRVIVLEAPQPELSAAVEHVNQLSGGQVRGRSVLCGTGDVGAAGQAWRSCRRRGVFRRSSMSLPASSSHCAILSSL